MDEIETSLELEITRLRYLLKVKKKELETVKLQKKITSAASPTLTNTDIARFSRQIILPQIGVKGQLKLKNASVLIVGVGGLGCPAAQYLVGAGVGRIGLNDYDEVDINNLHRQLLHTEESVGTPKTGSAQSALLKLNSLVEITVHNTQLSSVNALDIISKYDVILDASDNVPTRYLLNDACVMLGRPLVSGAALKFEGQLSVYNYDVGPCYRCIFPTPPPATAVTNCSDGGVLGVIPGIIGTMQALEAIKIILGEPGVLAGKLMLFDGTISSFRTVKLRGQRESCDVCSENPIITQLVDYEMFCGMSASDKDPKINLMNSSERKTVQDLSRIIANNEPCMLIDVRTSNEFEICHLKTSVNVPIKDVLENKSDATLWERATIENLPIVVICRRGNDSQIAAKHLQQQLRTSNLQIVDVIGGLHFWTQHVDPTFPIY